MPIDPGRAVREIVSSRAAAGPERAAAAPIRDMARALAGILLLVGCTAASPAARRPPPALASSAAGSPTAERRTPLAFVAHPTRPPLDLSLVQASALLAGEVADWRGIGGPAGPLRLLAGPAAPVAATVPRAPSDAAVVEAVAADTAALGIVAGSAAGPGVRALRVAGTDPLRDPAPYALKVEGDAPARVVTAIAVGDVMLGRRVGARMARLGDFGAPFRRTAARLAAADLAFGNFESTLARGRPTVQPPGQSFAANPRALEGIRRAGLDLLSLANNHAADFGPASLLETLRLFEEARIATVGAGRDEARARAPAILERGGVRFGFLAFNAIGETPAPGAARPGAVRIRMQPRLGPLDRDDLEAFLADVRALRPRVDVLVVYPHWGRQYSHRAHPDQREVARAIVRAGVDLVVGTHPHWVGGAEIYRGKLIAYSLGNFVFDMDFSQKTQEGLALELVFWDGALKAAEFLPLRIGRDLAPRFLPWAAGRGILEDVWEASGTPFRLGPR